MVFFQNTAAATTNGWAPPGVVMGKRRIHVMHLIHTMAYGGVETALINWALNLNPERFTVRLVCFSNPGGGGTEVPFVQAAEAQGLKVDRIPWSRRKPLIAAGRALRKLMREYQVDILHTHNWYADFVGVLAARGTGVKTVSTVYVWSRFDWKRNLLQRLDRWALHYFDQVTAHCQDTFDKTVSMGFPEERLRLLIAGYDANPVTYTPEDRIKKRREHGIGDDEILLANVARFYPEKAQDMLLRVFRRIVDREPRARLWMFGVGPLEGELRALCSELKLDENVRFLGFVDNLLELLPLVDIQVHPSHMEGVALAILAGMSTGLPIVASDVGSLSEVLHDKQNSILTPAGNEAGFEAAVLDLMERPDKARRLGDAARDFIMTQYSLKSAVERVESTYFEVLQNCESVCLS